MTTLGNKFSLFVHGVYGIVETLYGLASLCDHCLVLVPLQVECFKNFLLAKTRPHQWRPPDLHSFKASFDAAVFQATNTAGIGVIIRHSNGEVIGAISMPIPLSQSVAELETLACLRAVQFALEIGLRRVTFDGDSVTVINSIDRGFPEFLHMGILLMTFGFKLLLFNFHVFVMLNAIVKLWLLL